MKTGTLYLIPTPINDKDLKDILLPEYIDIISELKTFIVETPKNARRNLGTLPMKTKMQEIVMYELSEHTNDSELSQLIKPLLNGENVGVMSDAGVPSVADPGYRVVREAQKYDIKVVPFVGPSSILLSLMASGLNGQNFAFNGYLPKDTEELKKRIRFLENLSIKINQTQIFMDTPYRNQKLFENIMMVCDPNTSLCIALNVGNEDGYIKTLKIKEWRNCKIDLPKQPCLFLMN